jgi:hypothetical protein
MALRVLCTTFALMAALLASATALADPPGRVGRLSWLAGEVTFQSTYTGEATAAQLNWPVTGQNVITTGPGARAEIRIGSSAVRLDGDTELEFAQLDDASVRMRVLAGRVALRVKSREKVSEFEVRTPHGRALLEDVGRYRFETRGQRDSSGATVYQGALRLDLAETSIPVRSGGRVDVWGAPGRLEYRQGEAFRDEFDDWNLARDRRDDASRSARYVSSEMTGYDDLDDHGEWREVADYGPVWVPHTHALPVGWAPYRTGRWAWVDPWGWTWIDAAPWGFAPFHYGRWVHVDNYWAWTPGVVVRRPVFAPALVGWFGRPGTGVSISVGPAVGWFPLAPREVYHPAYPCSPTYVRNINVTHVTNVTQINVAPNPVLAADAAAPLVRANYRNANLPHAVTMVPENVFKAGRPVAPAVVTMRDPRTLQSLPVVEGASRHAPPRPLVTMMERRGAQQPNAGQPAVAPMTSQPAAIGQPVPRAHRDWRDERTRERRMDVPRIGGQPAPGVPARQPMQRETRQEVPRMVIPPAASHATPQPIPQLPPVHREPRFDRAPHSGVPGMPQPHAMPQHDRHVRSGPMQQPVQPHVVPMQRVAPMPQVAQPPRVEAPRPQPGGPQGNPHRHGDSRRHGQ